jgi:hypothetical protein
LGRAGWRGQRNGERDGEPDSNQQPPNYRSEHSDILLWDRPE